MASGALNCVAKEINPAALGPGWFERTVDRPLKFKAIPEPLSPLIWPLHKLCFGRGSESKFLSTRICPDGWPEPRECSRVCVHSEDGPFYRRDYSLMEGGRNAQPQSADLDTVGIRVKVGDRAARRALSR